jgi:hypothetical protein
MYRIQGGLPSHRLAPRIDEVQPSTLTGDLYSPSVIVLRSGRRCPGRTPAAITPQLLGVNDVEQLFA